MTDEPNTQNKTFIPIIIGIVLCVCIYTVFLNRTVTLPQLPEIGEEVEFLMLHADYPEVTDSLPQHYQKVEVQNIQYKIYVIDGKVSRIKTCDKNFKNIEGLSPGTYDLKELHEKYDTTRKSLFTLVFKDQWALSKDKSTEEYCFVKRTVAE